jgi:SAM-dependent methyltransferase
VIPPLSIPQTDPTGIFEYFNAGFGSKILVASAMHLNIFGRLADGPLPREGLRSRLGLAERPMSVVVTALKAFGLLHEGQDGRLGLTELARTHLVPGGEFDVSDYLALAGDAPGVKDLFRGLRTNQPKGDSPEGAGAAYIAGDGVKSAMQVEGMAEWLTERLAGRAKSTAAKLVERAPLDGARLLLDVGGGTGIFSIAYLQRYPALQAIILELEHVAKVAACYAKRYGVADRLSCVSGDMFACSFPKDVDAILLSNILHDWDVPKCLGLLRRCFDALRPGGRLLIHDVLLDDDLSGPLHIAIYSVVLFYLTEGRAYSAAEFNAWLGEVGLIPSDPQPTLVHCSVISAVKP